MCFQERHHQEIRIEATPLARMKTMYETIFFGVLSALLVFGLFKRWVRHWDRPHTEQPVTPPINYFFKEDGYERRLSTRDVLGYDRDRFGVTFLLLACAEEEISLSSSGRTRVLTLSGRGFALCGSEFRHYYHIEIVGNDVFDKGKTFIGYDHKWDTEKVFKPVIRLSLPDYEFVLSKIQGAVDGGASCSEPHFIHLALDYEKIAFEQKPFEHANPCYGITKLSELETYDLKQAVNTHLVHGLQRMAADGSAEERERHLEILTRMYLPVK